MLYWRRSALSPTHAPCYTAVMDSHTNPRREQVGQRWVERLEAAGLGGLWGALHEGLKPLGPLAAQLIWFAQPGLALFGQSDPAGELAALLNGDLASSPGGDTARSASGLHEDNR